MRPDFLLSTPAGASLYQEARSLPIVDYHCHLSPREIYEDQPFTDLAQLWLGGDHYKWRLMRAFGVEEQYITGDAPGREKFLRYGECIGLAAGNPLSDWTAMELSMYFHIDTPLCRETAAGIWEEAGRVIREERLSPQKLIQASGVERLVTTDDPADSLEYHRLLKDFPVGVTPAFRTDTLVNLRAPGWRAYIDRLGERAGPPIRDLDSLEQAVRNRLDAFQELGCRLSDVGIEAFPDGTPCTREEAAGLLRRALDGEILSLGEYRRFLRYFYRFLGEEYRQRGMVMQYHLAVKRNASTRLFREIGPDAGGDCAGDPIPLGELVSLLDELERADALPRTILYTLNPSMYLPMATAAGSFRGVTLGAAWWFNDHQAGIEEQLKLFSQTGHLAVFTGMLTDSRSFLSYARHDYFRRILCSLLGEWMTQGRLEEGAGRELVRRICYQNSRDPVV